MDWQALWLSLSLAAWTVAVLLPISVLAGQLLATRTFRGKGLVEGLVMLPLVLPPTVFGFYLLVTLGGILPLARSGRICSAISSSSPSKGWSWPR